MSNIEDGLTLTLCRGDKELIINDPDNATLERAIKSLTSSSDDFFILSKGEHNYLQGFRTEDVFDIDYREDPHMGNFITKDKPLSVTLNILQNFIQGIDFKKGHEWQPSGDNPYLNTEAVEDTTADLAIQAALEGKFERPFVFNDSTNPIDIHGYIGYYGLADWWLKEFSIDERCEIEETEHSSHDSFDLDAFTEWSDEILDEHPTDEEKTQIDIENIQIAKDLAAEGIPCEVIDSSTFLTRGDVGFIPDPAGSYLCGLSSMVCGNNRLLGLRIAKKSKELLDEYGRNSKAKNKAFV